MIIIINVILAILYSYIIISVYKKYKVYDVLSIKEGLCMTGLPVITLFNGKNHYNFILDTGSDNNRIDSTLFKTIEGASIIDKDIHEAAMPNGDTLTSNTGKATLSVNNKSFNLYFEVSDYSHIIKEFKKSTGVHICGFLGNEFFIENKYILDFDKLKIYHK